MIFDFLRAAITPPSYNLPSDRRVIFEIVDAWRGFAQERGILSRVPLSNDTVIGRESATVNDSAGAPGALEIKGDIDREIEIESERDRDS